MIEEIARKEKTPRTAEHMLVLNFGGRTVMMSVMTWKLNAQEVLLLTLMRR